MAQPATDTTSTETTSVDTKPTARDLKRLLLELSLGALVVVFMVAAMPDLSSTRHWIAFLSIMAAFEVAIHLGRQRKYGTDH